MIHISLQNAVCYIWWLKNFFVEIWQFELIDVFVKEKEKEKERKNNNNNYCQ